jgi:hypothetical protein
VNQMMQTTEDLGVERQNEMHYGLVVGINRYPGIRDLRGNARDLRAASSDADDFERWLLEPTGGNLPAANIAVVRQDSREFTGPDNAEPTRTVVNRELGKLIAAFKTRLKEDPMRWEQSRLYVYVSGHGIATDAREAALLMANATPDAGGESVAARRYLEYFQDTQLFRELVFFADCCRTERINARLEGPPWNFVRSNYGPVSAVLGFATEFGELAYEPTAEEVPNADEARGYFTKALLEGLQGGAAEHGWVNSASLEKFVRDRVPQLTAKKKPPQEAPFIVQVKEPIRFCRAEEPSWLITIEFPDGFTGTVELFRNAEQLLGRWDVAQGPWRISLPKSSYEVRLAGAEDGTYWKGDGLFRVMGEPRSIRLVRSEP